MHSSKQRMLPINKLEPMCASFIITLNQSTRNNNGHRQACDKGVFDDEETGCMHIKPVYNMKVRRNLGFELAPHYRCGPEIIPLNRCSPCVNSLAYIVYCVRYFVLTIVGRDGGQCRQRWSKWERLVHKGTDEHNKKQNQPWPRVR